MGRTWNAVGQSLAGDVVAVADKKGAVKERFLYDAFGQPMFLEADFDALANPSQSAYAWEHLYGGLRYEPTTGLYFAGGGYCHPRLGRLLLAGPLGNIGEGRLNAYAAGFPTTAPPPLRSLSLEEFRFWSELTPHEQSAMLESLVGLGVAAVGLTIVSGGTALPAMGALVAGGAIVGGIHGGLETYAATVWWFHVKDASE